MNKKIVFHNIKNNLPFNISLSNKFNDINIDEFPNFWEENKKNRRIRNIAIDNELHLELNKFATYNISIDEILDLMIRYSFNKREFKKLSAQLIKIKNQ